MARRRHTPEQIHHQAAGGRGGFGAGAVGGAGLQGAWGDGADVLALAQEGCGGMRVAPGQAAGAVGGVKDARPGAGGGRSDGRQPGLCGKRPEGDLVGPTRRRRAVTQAQRALAVPVVWGLSGVGPAPVPPGATVPVGRTTGAAPWSHELWGWLMGFGRVRRTGGSLPCRRAWGLDGQPQAGGSASGGRRGPGCRVGNRSEAVCGRPAGPGSGCALPTAIHVWAHRPGWRPEPTTDGPCGCRPWQGETHPATPLATGVARRVPGPTSVLSSLTELFDCPRASRAPGRRQPAPGFTNQAVPGWLSRAGTRPPLHPARQPQRGNGYIRESFNGKLRDELHRPRDLLHPPGSPGSRSRAGARPTAQLRPHKPARVPPTST